MSDLVLSPGSCSIGAAAAAPPVAAPAPHDFSFRDLLSELNPLQYIPVVGMLYRAITGDTIPETVRQVGSFAVSGLMGGPVGLAMNAAFLGLEKLTGIDPEKIGQSILASLGIGHSDETQVAGIARVLPELPVLPEPAAVAVAWSASQLTAYGISTGSDGTLARGDLHGSDVLNDLFLASYRAPASITV